MIDYNKQQSYSTTWEVLDLEPLADKWKAFGFAVAEVDGHSVTELQAVLQRVPLAPRSGPARSSAIRSKARESATWKIISTGTIRTAPRRKKSNRCWPPWRRTDAKNMPRHGLRAGQARPANRVHRFRSGRGHLGPLQGGNARTLLHGRRQRGQRGRHGRRPGPGRQRGLHQYDRHLSYPPLFRPDRLGPLPAQRAGAVDRQRGGMVYAPLGPTHEAIEDIAILRASRA